jgi:hypothetical protein
VCKDDASDRLRIDDRDLDKGQRTHEIAGWPSFHTASVVNGNSSPQHKADAQHDTRVKAALAGMAAKLGLLQGQLADIDLQMDEWRRR